MSHSLSSTTEVGRNYFYLRDSPSEMLPTGCIMVPCSREEKTLVALLSLIHI